jgi:hypothetical protein
MNNTVTFSTYGTDVNFTKIMLINLKERSHLGDKDVCERIILK